MRGINLRRKQGGWKLPHKKKTASKKDSARRWLRC